MSDMKKEINVDTYPYLPVEVTVDVIGGEWKGLILLSFNFWY